MVSSGPISKGSEKTEQLLTHTNKQLIRTLLQQYSRNCKSRKVTYDTILHTKSQLVLDVRPLNKNFNDRCTRYNQQTNKNFISWCLGKLANNKIKSCS